MGTRAIYQFNNVTIYNHWDGYPEGAAVKLLAALEEESCRGLDVQFIRANTEAEITEPIQSVRDLGSTDIQGFYQIQQVRNDPGGWVVTAYYRSPGDEFRQVFRGGLLVFIECHLGDKIFAELEIAGMTRFVTNRIAKRLLAEDEKLLATWAAKGRTGYNYDLLIERIKRLNEICESTRVIE